MSYSKQDLLKFIQEFVETRGTLPNRRTIREMGISDSPFYRHFDSFTKAVEEYATQPLEVTAEQKAALTSKKPVKPAYGCNIIHEDADEPEGYEEPVISKARAKILERISGMSDRELEAFGNSAKGGVGRPQVYITDTKETGMFKFIATGDSHMGHEKFREDWWGSMVERGIKENVDWMYHTGDILEGMSNRPGHVYELAHIGFEEQFAVAKRMIKDVPFQVKGIIGNHDLWYMGKADQGINVGMRLEESLSNFTFLGPQEADEIVNGITIKLWHGLDGSSYATSYRTQKFIEHLSGGEKPHVLLAGHAHKSIYHVCRNVHVLETGTLCGQTGFMRGKKLAAHTGYWIVTCYTNAQGLVRIVPEWNAFY